MDKLQSQLMTGKFSSFQVLQTYTKYIDLILETFFPFKGKSFDCLPSFFSVVFQFKSSKKSNNGTDVNAGQIPQLLYR